MQGTFPPKGNPAIKTIVQAPVLLARCPNTNTSGYCKKMQSTQFGDWLMYDLGLATQNLCLAAHDFGLGTVIAGLFDHSRSREVLGVFHGYELLP